MLTLGFELDALSVELGAGGSCGGRGGVAVTAGEQEKDG